MNMPTSVSVTIAGIMKRRKSAHLKSKYQLEIRFAVTTAQALYAARKLDGHQWTTQDIAKLLVVDEYQVRAAVSWLLGQGLIRIAGEEKRNLVKSRRPGTYKVTTYTITDTGTRHEFTNTHRGSRVEHYGNVAALEIALGFSRAFAR